jgi:thiamine-phosphate pyrophosphorylase
VTAAAGRSAFTGLHVLADDDPRWQRDPPSQARLALEGGAHVIQLRAKSAGDRQILEWAREIRQLTRKYDARFVVNDRFDLALASDADAVHLGQDDLPPDAIPKSVRGQLAVGRSTHDIDQARRALREGVDYLAFGPLFGTTSKETPYDARGLEALRAIADLCDGLPLIAIGGISAENLPAALAAGATGVAVISTVIGAKDPVAATRRLCRGFPDDAPRSPSTEASR